MFGGGRGERGRSGWDGPVGPPESLDVRRTLNLKKACDPANPLQPPEPRRLESDQRSDFGGFSPECQERKISPKRKFSGQISRGHPGVIHADIPAQNFGQGPRNPGKTSIWARTSTTRRRGRPRPQGIFKNFGQKNIWAEFSFPRVWCANPWAFFSQIFGRESQIHCRVSTSPLGR